MDIDGLTTFTMPTPETTKDREWHTPNPKIKLYVTVTERNTRKSETVNHTFHMNQAPVRVRITGSRTNFTPGIPTSLKVEVRTPDNLPAERTITLRTLFFGHPSVDEPVQEQRVITRQGTALVDLPTPEKALGLLFAAVHEKTGEYDGGWVLTRHSPSGSFIHILPDTTEPHRTRQDRLLLHTENQRLPYHPARQHQKAARLLPGPLPEHRHQIGRDGLPHH